MLKESYIIINKVRYIHVFNFLQPTDLIRLENLFFHHRQFFNVISCFCVNAKSTINNFPASRLYYPAQYIQSLATEVGNSNADRKLVKTIVCLFSTK